MKPFDLEAAKAGALCVTRDGFKAELIHSNFKGDGPLVFKVTDNDKAESIYCSGLDGSFRSGRSSNRDIFMAPTKASTWMNIYSSSFQPNKFYSGCYDSEDEANESAGSDRIKCIFVEWEE